MVKKFIRKGKIRFSNEIVYIIGNGISRQDINLNSLKSITIGCNVIYKDFMPTILTSICRHIILDILKTKPQVLEKLIIPRSTIPNLYCAPKYKNYLFNNNCSLNHTMQYLTTGNFAIHYAITTYKPKYLHLIGFDNNTTNIYYGHEYYSEIKGTSATNWKKNLNQLNYILQTNKYVREK